MEVDETLTTHVYAVLWMCVCVYAISLDVSIYKYIDARLFLFIIAIVVAVVVVIIVIVIMVVILKRVLSMFLDLFHYSFASAFLSLVLFDAVVELSDCD